MPYDKGEMIVNGLSLAATASGLALTVTVYMQAIRLYRLKAAKELSLGLVATFVVASSVWSAYGIATNNWPVIIVNVSAVPGWLIVAYFRVRYRAH